MYDPDLPTFQCGRCCRKAHHSWWGDEHDVRDDDGNRLCDGCAENQLDEEREKPPPLIDMVQFATELCGFTKEGVKWSK